MKKDLVSVITPLYNSEEYIIETLETVKNQTYSQWEMFIVNDCSTDNSEQVVKDYIEGDNRFRLINLDVNSGAAVARNTGIDAAEGQYIAFIDSDDQWFPDKLEKQLKFMKDRDYSFTFTSYQKMKDDGTLLDIFINPPKEFKYNNKALMRNPIGCLTVIYDISKIGKQFMPLIRKRQDYALWLKIAKQGINGYSLHIPLAYYRNRKDSISSNKLPLIKYQWQLYRNIEKLGILYSAYLIVRVTINKFSDVLNKKKSNHIYL